MIETFNFPLPPTLNQIIRTARGNIYSSAQVKRRWTGNIALMCMGRPQFPAQIWVEFVWKIKRLSTSDADNTSAASKFIFDGLVEAGIIKDDSLKFVMSPLLHWYEKGDNSVETRIADHPIWNGKPVKLCQSQTALLTPTDTEKCSHTAPSCL